MPRGSVPLPTSNPSSVLLEGSPSRVGQRPQSSPLPRTNPVNGDLLPANAVEARNNGRFQVQSNTNWFTSIVAKVAVLPYAILKVLFTIPALVIDALPKRGLQDANRTNFRVHVPGANELLAPGALQAITDLMIDGDMLPRRIPKEMTSVEMRAQVQAKINSGHDILESVRNGTRPTDQPATKRDISNIAFYLQARGQLANEGEAFRAGAFNIPDPEGRIRKFLDSCPDAYQRASSHTKKFQELDGARHRGIDLPEGGGSSLDEAMPYGMETLLYGSLLQNEDMCMPETRLFLKMEPHGAWLSKPQAGYEQDAPRRPAQIHDVGAFVGHACSFLATRGQGAAAGSRKERIHTEFKTEFKKLLRDAPGASEMLNKDDPMNESMGVRVAFRNAHVALNLHLDVEESVAVHRFITYIENKYPHRPEVRIGNEIIFDNQPRELP